ncbi:protein of unknown function [Methylocaldum szegediense]|uniref:Uncharacterized protein n=1 Tax=Methylocaldum szegediense TaxID=73780 RepID=A0ABM9I449_9GAMM|nr:protein of unknown function [Methylocaldum szegediense]
MSCLDARLSNPYKAPAMNAFRMRRYRFESSDAPPSLNKPVSGRQDTLPFVTQKNMFSTVGRDTNARLPPSIDPGNAWQNSRTLWPGAADGRTASIAEQFTQ